MFLAGLSKLYSDFPEEYFGFLKKRESFPNENSNAGENFQFTDKKIFLL